MRFYYDHPDRKLTSTFLSPELIDIEGVTPGDYIVERISQTGTFYEHDLLEHLKRTYVPRGMIFDVGANIGNHSIYFAKYLAEHVVAIEPSDAAIGALRRNITNNNLDNITVLRCAVGAKRGRGYLRLPEDAGENFGRMQVVSKPTTTAEKKARVSIRTIDDIASCHASASTLISLIKINVEGMSMEVLEGARKILESRRPDLVLELLTEQEQTAAFDLLEPYGYICLGEFCKTPTFHFTARH